jgi:hypothetical protein
MEPPWLAPVDGHYDKSPDEGWQPELRFRGFARDLDYDALAASGRSANAIAFPSGSGTFTWRTPLE